MKTFALNNWVLEVSTCTSVIAYRTVVFKWVALGSPREEYFFNSWKKICSREELGRKSCGWTNLVFIICLFNT